MRNILLSLFFFIKKDNVFSVQDSHGDEENILIYLYSNIYFG